MKSNKNLVDLIKSIGNQIDEGVLPGIEEVSELHEKSVEMFWALMVVSQDENIWDQIDEMAKQQILRALGIPEDSEL